MKLNYKNYISFEKSFFSRKNSFGYPYPNNWGLQMTQKLTTKPVRRKKFLVTTAVCETQKVQKLLLTLKNQTKNSQQLPVAFFHKIITKSLQSIGTHLKIKETVLLFLHWYPHQTKTNCDFSQIIIMLFLHNHQLFFPDQCLNRLVFI